jgi:hypothetical protein
LELPPRYVSVSFKPDIDDVVAWANDEALVSKIAGKDREYHSIMNIAGRRFGQVDLEFCCEDEADAQQLYTKLRDALPKRFRVAAPTSASKRD